MAGRVVGGAPAGRFPATPGHDDEAAVKEALGLGKQSVKAAAGLAFGGGKGCGGNAMCGHGGGASETVTLTYNRHQGENDPVCECENAQPPRSLRKPANFPKAKELAQPQFFSIRNRCRAPSDSEMGLAKVRGRLAGAGGSWIFAWLADSRGGSGLSECGVAWPGGCREQFRAQQGDDTKIVGRCGGGRRAAMAAGQGERQGHQWPV